jgi:hypothetical protein
MPRRPGKQRAPRLTGRAPRSGAREVEAAFAAVQRRLDEGLYRIRFEKGSPGEQLYLRAMAELGHGRTSSGDVARLMGRSLQQVSAQRDRLISKGIIYSPAHNVVEFSVPGFADFLLRLYGIPPHPSSAWDQMGS